MHTDEGLDGECRECADLLEALSEYLDGNLAAEMRTELLVHAQTCSECARLLYSLRRLVATCQSQPNCEMPAEVRTQLWVTIRQELYTQSDQDSA